MFYQKVLAASVLALVIVFEGFSQTSKKEARGDLSSEVRDAAVELLREAAAEAGTMRTLENRLGSTAEMAALMWYHDRREGQSLYQTVINDFKQLILQYDAEMNTIGYRAVDRREVYQRGEQSDAVGLERKVSKAAALRRQIALNLAEHEPDLAFGFFQDTLQIITNAELRKQIESQDEHFEWQLIAEIAHHSPAKAVEYGRKTLEREINWQHLDLLRKLYAQDPEKGAEYAAAIVKKLRSGKMEPTTVGWILQRGAENLDSLKKNGGRKPMFAEQDLRDLAEMLAGWLLQDKASGQLDSNAHLALVERFAPNRAVQIRAKFSQRSKQPKRGGENGSDDAPPVKVMEEAENLNGEEPSPTEELLKDLQNLGDQELSPEEREKIVLKARKLIADLPGRQAKIVALTGLAAQVARRGDKELAAEIMRDAQSLVNPLPKTRRDYLETCLVIAGLADTDPPRAFALLEETILRLNDTLAAFIKVGEFIDDSGEIIEDGEVQIGSFGGSLTREITGNLGQAESVIRSLALADFNRMKAVTNKFERTEARVLAKMLVLRAVLDRRAPRPETETPGNDSFD